MTDTTMSMRGTLGGLASAERVRRHGLNDKQLQARRRNAAIARQSVTYPPQHRVTGVCYLCGGVATTMDHVMPGSEVQYPACVSCNASKHSRSLGDHLRRVQR